jgi:hypothetical protein
MTSIPYSQFYFIRICYNRSVSNILCFKQLTFSVVKITVSFIRRPAEDCIFNAKVDSDSKVVFCLTNPHSYYKSTHWTFTIFFSNCFLPSMVGSVSKPSLHPPNALSASKTLATFNRKTLLESSSPSQHDGRRTGLAPVRCQLVDVKDDCLKESASSKGGLCKAWTMYKEFEAFRLASQFS